MTWRVTWRGAGTTRRHHGVINSVLGLLALLLAVSKNKKTKEKADVEAHKRFRTRQSSRHIPTDDGRVPTAGEEEGGVFGGPAEGANIVRVSREGNAGSLAGQRGG